MFQLNKLAIDRLATRRFSEDNMCKQKHAFSIEMKSKQYVKQIIVTNDAHNRVLFEGFLGDLQALTLHDEEMLEIEGSFGTLRLDIQVSDLKKIIQSQKNEDTMKRGNAHARQS
jgi:DNA-binding sugar fermentation-stimulating protein